MNNNDEAPEGESKRLLKWKTFIGWLQRLGRRTPTVILRHKQSIQHRPRGEGYVMKLNHLADALASRKGTSIVIVSHDHECACLITGRALDCHCDPQLEIGGESDRNP